MNFIKPSNRPSAYKFSQPFTCWEFKLFPGLLQLAHLSLFRVTCPVMGRAGRRTIVVGGLQDRVEVLGPTALCQDSHTGQAALLTGKV